MRKLSDFLTPLAAAGFLLAPVFVTPAVLGEEATRLTPGSFNAVVVKNGLQVELAASLDGPAVEITGPEAAIRRVSARVSDGVLSISPRTSLGSIFSRVDLSELRIIARPDAPLRGVRAANGAMLSGVIATEPEFKVRAVNGAVIELTGGCTSLDAAAARGAIISLGELECVHVTAAASMGGVVSAWASESKAVGASMGGDVTVGGPGRTVESSSSMGGATDS